MLEYTNRENRPGTLREMLVDADVFIGVSKGNLISAEDVSTMAKDSIVLAMANPIPEIMPDEAKRGGAAIVGTGRSDFANQVNNVLAFPGIFRGALDSGSKSISEEMKLAAARALAATISEPTAEKVLPDPLDKTVAPLVAAAVCEAANDHQAG
jgi:malate dehydrogenase (oxaloacetate-decarboxylating)